MPGIFISYRREDTEGQAGRFFDDLSAHFGENSVFMDVAGLEPGRDFRKAIEHQVTSCAVLLAVIGTHWLDMKDESGHRRLDDPNDFVRLETAHALKRDIPVVPVLVQGARMPRADQLPVDLRALAWRNAVEVTHARWDSDIGLLIKALRPYVDEKVVKGRSWRAILGLLVMMIVLTAGGLLIYKHYNQKATLIGPRAEVVEAGGTSELPYFMTRSVTEDDLKGKSKWELDIMRNEIFARHGRRFARTDLQAYFDKQKWYVPKYSLDSFPSNLLTEIQQKNVAFISHYQQTR